MGILSRYGLEGLSREAWVIFAIRTLNSLGFSMAMPFFGIYLLEARGVSLATTGLVYFAAGALNLVSQVAGGRLTDAVGPKKVMLAGYFTSILTSVALGTMVLEGSSPIFFFIAYPLFSLLRGFSNPATGSIIAEQPREQLRPGYNLLTIGGNLGFAIGPAVGGPITDLFGYSTVFYLSAAIVLPVIVLTVFMIRGGIRHRKEDGGAVTRNLSWKGDRNIILFLFLTGCLFVSVGYEITPISLYVADFLRFSNTQIGYLFATNGLVIVLLQFPIISLVQRSRTLVLPLLISPLLVIVSFVMAALSASFLEFEGVMVAITLGEILLTVPSQLVIALFSRSGNRGTYQGYYYAATNSGRSIASAVGPTSFELLAFAPALGWYAIAGFTLCVFFGFLLLGPRIQRDYERREMVEDHSRPAAKG
jgi:predicted MFS family arabinose efflux permease